MSSHFPSRASIALLTLVFCAAAQAQQAAGYTSNPASVSPYIQQRSRSYTSFDNPYEPGGIYDPYRTNRRLGLQVPGAPRQAAGQKAKSGSSRSQSGQMASLNGSGPGSPPGGASAQPGCSGPSISAPNGYTSQITRNGLSGTGFNGINTFAPGCDGNTLSGAKSLLGTGSGMNSLGSRSSGMGMQSQFGKGGVPASVNHEIQQMQQLQKQPKPLGH